MQNGWHQRLQDCSCQVVLEWQIAWRFSYAEDLWSLTVCLVCSKTYSERNIAAVCSSSLLHCSPLESYHELFFVDLSQGATF